MRLVLTLTLALASFALPSSGHAQRRAPQIVDVALTTDAAHPYQYRVTVVARADAEIVADVRWLHLDVRAAGTHRSIGCDSPTRPRRLDPAALRTLHAGESWTESFDVRTICWGRALTSLSGGGELGGSLGTTRSHTGARVPSTATFRPASIPFTPTAPVPAPVVPAGDVHVTLAPADAITGSRITLRVTVRATRAIRAWVRPDRFRFRVRGPDGETHTCSMSHGQGAAIPDLFARVGTRSGPRYSLEARAFCDADVFEAAGIYEVTPILDLDVDGSEWRFDSPQGAFEGAPAFVRVRSGVVRGRS